MLSDGFRLRNGLIGKWLTTKHLDKCRVVPTLCDNQKHVLQSDL